MQQAVPGTSTFSRRRLSTGFKHLVGDTQTTFSSFMARWKTFFVFCLVESRPATHEFWRLCRNALDENSDENAPGKRYMLRACKKAERRGHPCVGLSCVTLFVPRAILLTEQ
ncbi:hypothetical protein BKA60DRAFT_543208 [Fusarium oxysporum]|nr:hypothetical protein BKA60DRAFT_543208 [Fusarium oxysporum]